MGKGNFYKGEKKKQKKDNKQSSGNLVQGAPTFSMPEVIKKNKQQEE